MKRELSHDQREALGVLNFDTSGLYEHPDVDDRILIGAERARSILFNEMLWETETPLRILVVAPGAHHARWTTALQSVLPEEEVPVGVTGSPKTNPFLWKKRLLNPKVSNVSIISWENMRGQIPASLKTSSKPTRRDIVSAMKEGTIPPWRSTGIWDLVIADDSDRLAFRSNLQAAVIKMIPTHNKLALSGRAEGSHPEGLWSTLNWLWPTDFKAFWSWTEYRFHVDPVKMGRHIQFTEIGEELRPGARWEGVPCAVRR